MESVIGFVLFAYASILAFCFSVLSYYFLKKWLKCMSKRPKQLDFNDKLKS